MSYSGTYITEGLSQEKRFPMALNPDHFKIDERSVDDLLLFVTELSWEYNYFDAGNNLQGNWLDFFLSDGNLMLRIFPHFDFKNYFLKYDRMKQELYIETNENELTGKLKNMVEFIYSFLYFQKRMYDKFQTSIIGKDFDKMREFTNIVGTAEDYEVARRSFYSLSLHIENKLQFSYSIPKSEFFADPAVLPNTPFAFNDEFSLYSNINNAIKTFDELFSKFDIMYNRLVNASDYFFQKQKKDQVTFRPHISLILSFLDLYQLLKKEINEYNRKHLDLFYSRILDIKPKKASADKVSVILKLNNGVDELLIEKGERMLATIPGVVKKEQFLLAEDFYVNRTRIASLKTIYKSKYQNFAELEEGVGPINDFKLYAADIPNVEPADFENNDPGRKEWPIFGEDQRYLPSNEQSMDEAEIGMLVSSALFYAVDGHRLFSIKFHLNPVYFESFNKHADDHELATGINKKVIIAEMLKRAFIIDITGTGKWTRIPEYSTTCSIAEETDKFIEIQFKLRKEDPAVDVYMPEFHGPDYGTAFPAVRLILNNNSFHNPYAFFYEQAIERISINVTVRESSSLKLQNNIGALSVANPFHLFGPQPTLGSYLDIRNANIFNRYTRDFKIRLRWFDIPKNKDGFKTYYEVYENNITNSSFKVGLSGLVNDNSVLKTDEQQLFELFEMNKNPGRKQYLSDITSIENIDLQNIRFDNDLQLGNENESASMKNGSVRIELLEPTNAFCHKLYPVIFPKILMQNSKWFAKKRETPNQPYTPMVRLVEIDYELHHSEAISGKNVQGEQCSIGLWHIYPFGYKKTYPADKKEKVSLIPTINDEGNLYIGLTEAQPRKVLTLLFQMEENNFVTLSEEEKPILWSYLHHNDWKSIDPTNILEDNTIGFKGTGIIKIVIPEIISTGNTLFDPEFFWIRVSCDQFIGSRIKAVFTQVVTVVRELDTMEENTGLLRLNPFLLTEFVRKIPEVSSISQPFESYHGKAGETKKQFYTWMSEHLKHKKRLITSGDISQNILELFPEIQKVICYCTPVEKMADHSGEDVQVMVIPKMKYANPDRIRDPKVNIYTLYKIQNFLNQNISPFLKLTVCNPDYERLKVFCSVIFKDVKKYRSKGLLVQKLNKDIKKFISPWLFSEAAEINTNNGIYPSEILNFIKKLPYISFVSGFNVVQFYSFNNPIKGKIQGRLIDATAIKDRGEHGSFIYPGPGLNMKLIFKGSKPGAILISADEHKIIVIEKQTSNSVINKDDEVKPPKAGIGQLAIGKEFLVMNPYEVSAFTGVTVPAKKVEEDEIDFYYNANY
jgi:hypothetical protein